MECEDGINYPVRIVIDEYFIKELLKDKSKAVEIIEKLSKIHTTSRDYQWEHNLILDDSLKTAIVDKQIRGNALLGAMHGVRPEFLEGETDPNSKFVRFCISIAAKKPFKVYALTSKEQSKKYEGNKHYENPKLKTAIVFCYGELAYQVIDIFTEFSNIRKTKLGKKD